MIVEVRSLGKRLRYFCWSEVALEENTFGMR